ncbi:MAG: universal stress protein, partial [Anaerolineales bacterium]|nr:universal stress protein [Anaerolineales bacterium]
MTLTNTTTAVFGQGFLGGATMFGQFKKVLVPLDGSQLAERAIKPALALTRPCFGEVYLLQVTQPQEMLVPHHGGGYAFFWPDQSLERATEDATEYLDTVLDTFVDPAVTMHPLLEQGDPAGMIIDIAQNEQIDLVVMSSHGYTGVSRWVLGSTAEKVVREATCPVLVIRDVQPMRHMLVTLDGSHLAESILDPAFELARALGVSVTLLRVNQHREQISYRQVNEVERIEPGMGAAMIETFYRRDEMYLHDVA